MSDDDKRGLTSGGWFDYPHVYDKYDNYDADGDGDASIIRRCLHVHVTFEERCLHNKTLCLRSISAH